LGLIPRRITAFRRPDFFMIAREVSYEGRVQGVGFRYSVKELAKGFDIAGSVRNLPDGRVSVWAQGAEIEVKEFLTAIRESHLRAHISRHIIREEPVSKGLKGFEIRH
jgi:acylphosphatase